MWKVPERMSSCGEVHWSMYRIQDDRVYVVQTSDHSIIPAIALPAIYNQTERSLATLRNCPYSTLYVPWDTNPGRWEKRQFRKKSSLLSSHSILITFFTGYLFVYFTHAHWFRHLYQEYHSYTIKSMRVGWKVHRLTGRSCATAMKLGMH